MTIDEQLIHLATWRGRHGLRVPAKIEIDVRRWPPRSLAREALIAARSRSSLEPVSHALFHKVKRALHFISGEGSDLLSSPIGQISQARLIAFLEGMDNYFADISQVQSTKHTYVTVIRALLQHAPDRLSDGESLRETLIEFAPRQRRPRILRIDRIPAELGHIRHLNLKDLEAKAHSRLNTKLHSLEQAVELAFKSYESVLHYQRSILPSSIEEGEERDLRRWIFSNRKYNHLLPKFATDPKRFAGNVLRVLHDSEVGLSNRGWPLFRCPSHRRLKGVPHVREYICHDSAAPWFYSSLRLPNPVITAIFVQISAHTAWNVASVANLTTNAITFDSGKNEYRVQSYKRKTDDETPFVDVPASSRISHKAISLLLWNHSQLKKLGVISQDEERLWFGWGHDQRKPQDPVDKDKLLRFCQTGGIENFALSELRPIKAAVTYLSQKDIEAVRVLLGHTHLAVTDGYLRDSIFFRLNEANMLRFQRQIETTIVFIDGGKPALEKLGLLYEDVSNPNLWTTGDGGVCTTPMGSHPSTLDKEARPCAGVLCQYQNGCPSYKLHVSPASIEIALRTVEFYRTRWTELYHRNSEMFCKVHLPRLLYIRVLLDFVDDRRPDLLSAARMRLS